MSIRANNALAVIAAVLLFTTAAVADDTTNPPKSEGTEATAPATAPAPPPVDAGIDLGLGSPWSKLQIHGYLSQAYARADQHQIMGIPKEGTAEYREAALQFRYAIAKNDSFVLQIAHEKMGRSPIESPEIELDWGFYERRFGANTSLKVGRVQIPFGIYNETRDVGTVLPFYRLPVNYYGEEAYTSETCDGVVVVHRFAAESPWSVETSGYYGGWETLQIRETAMKGKMSDAIGGQLWLSTPIDGLRLGVGGFRATATGGFVPPGATQDQKTLHGSIDGNFERFMARGEYRRSYIEGGMGDTAMYAQVGYRFLPKAMLVVQADREEIHVPAMPPFVKEMDQMVGRDVAVAVNYFFRPDLVLKVESHRNRQVGVEDAVPSFNSVPRADYAIVSLSVSF